MDDPEKYPWIGHSNYLGKAKNDLIDQELVLSQFSRDKPLAGRVYNQFVLRELNGEHQKKYYEVKDQRYLGEEKFIEQIEGKKRSIEPTVYDIPLGEIALEVSKVTGIDQDRLYSLTRDRKGAYGQSLVAYLARKISGYLVKDIAEHFRWEAMTISHSIIKLEDLIQRDKDLEKTVEPIERDLIKDGKKKYLISIA